MGCDFPSGCQVNMAIMKRHKKTQELAEQKETSAKLWGSALGLEFHYPPMTGDDMANILKSHEILAEKRDYHVQCPHCMEKFDVDLEDEESDEEDGETSGDEDAINVDSDPEATQEIPLD
jgi:hypothetical protein